MLYPVVNEFRSMIDLNGIWLFKLEENEDHIDVSQPLNTEQVMAVPGSFNDQGVIANIRNHVGNVWYERTFTVPNVLNNERIVLRFGSATHKATVYIDGKEAKNEYRKFKITNDKNDDYNTMREVIYRRYFRVLKDNLSKPDLIIVDGGIGQMHVAREVIESLSLSIPVIGLKKDNHHATSALLAFDPIFEIPIDKNSNLFHYLERMQDEVHNFTINYHKNLRSKGSLESILSSIDGIGEKRKLELMRKYRSVSKIKEASVEELSLIMPNKIAITLHDFLTQMNGDI